MSGAALAADAERSAEQFGAVAVVGGKKLKKVQPELAGLPMFVDCDDREGFGRAVGGVARGDVFTVSTAEVAAKGGCRGPRKPDRGPDSAEVITSNSRSSPIANGGDATQLSSSFAALGCCSQRAASAFRADMASASISCGHGRVARNTSS